MLVSRSKPRELRAGMSELVYLVPELCRMTGLTDEMRANFHLMRSLAEHTRVGPDVRIQKLNNFCNRLLGEQAVRQDLEEWNLQLSNRLVEFNGRILPQEKILQAQDIKYDAGADTDWTRNLRIGRVYNFSFEVLCCAVLENAMCFQRALQIWDHVVNMKKKEEKLPKTKPVDTLKRAACAPFLKCKLAFCKMIADECHPFLQLFQTSKPMTPYLFEFVEKLLRYLMNRCVEPDLMKCTRSKLPSVDTKKSENFILSKNIDIGFASKCLSGETAITVTER
uniref:PAZ domain-containing protein n=1 Tax=Timema shepardi TaxID=629360 RepID=A0A7R9G1I8_TIMSH|nr:unnamed protein product [Timema shepardi]